MASTIHQQHHTLWRPTKYNKAWTGITGTRHTQITGQQCIWPYLHLPGNQVNTHSVWIPSKLNPAQGNPRRKWCRLASPFSWKCLQKLSQNRGDTERPSEKSQKNIRSTKPTATTPPTTDNKTLRGKRARNVYYKFYEAKKKTYVDQTGRLPLNYQRGYKYIMVMA